MISCMKLQGSCQCGKVTFTVESDTPYPYQICFCSICRKCTGGAFGCNIMGRRDTLEVRGARHLKRYHARLRSRGRATHAAKGWRVPLQTVVGAVAQRARRGSPSIPSSRSPIGTHAASCAAERATSGMTVAPVR
jgi:Glutathione-dependent formaldehyde-activating enzyme